VAGPAIETEEILVIETPERVQLYFALASIGNRFLACLLDHILQLLAIVLVLLVGLFIAYMVSYNFALERISKLIYALMAIFFSLVTTGYFVIFEWLWSGQTPGKRWMRLRVIREDGRPITFWEAAIRNFLRWFDVLPIGLYSVGLVSVFLSARDQRIGDFLAGTVVVREREAEAPSFTQVFSSPVTDLAYRRSFRAAQFTASLSNLTEREMEVVEVFLRRRWDLTESYRQWMAWRVAMPLMFRLRPAYDAASFTYEGFLEELLHRYRAEHRFVD
jgi:uncharacterized RDD family membrane protein YckC